MFRNAANPLKSFLLAIAIIFASLFSTVERSEATSLVIAVDHFILGDPDIIPHLPLGVVTIADIGVNTVQINVDLIPGVKYVNLGLMLSPIIDQSQLMLMSLSGDQMSLDTGGWLSYFPIKVEFNDRPTHPVAFTLSAPGLDVSDFLYLPPIVKYGGSIFAINLWYLQSGNMLDSTVGGTNVPEPLTSMLLGAGVLGLGMRKRRK